MLLAAKIYSRSEFGWKKISRAVAITGVHIHHVVTFLKKGDRATNHDSPVPWPELVNAISRSNMLRQARRCNDYRKKLPHQKCNRPETRIVNGKYIGDTNWNKIGIVIETKCDILLSSKIIGIRVQLK